MSHLVVGLDTPIPNEPLALAKVQLCGWNPPCTSLSEFREFGWKIQVWSLRDDLGGQQPAEKWLRTKHWILFWLKMVYFPR